MSSGSLCGRLIIPTVCLLIVAGLSSILSVFKNPGSQAQHMSWPNTSAELTWLSIGHVETVGPGQTSDAAFVPTWPSRSECVWQEFTHERLVCPHLCAHMDTRACGVLVRPPLPLFLPLYLKFSSRQRERR